jgi:uncharacterized membrane protein (DUF485 family)
LWYIKIFFGTLCVQILINAVLYWCSYFLMADNADNAEIERNVASLSLIPGVIMMMTYYMFHILLIDQIQSAYTDSALTYQIKKKQSNLNRILVAISFLLIVGFVVVNCYFVFNLTLRTNKRRRIFIRPSNTCL